MFLAEMFGTMILILLGDGVVANVLLNKSKGQNSGWIVITAGWAFAVMCGVFTSQALGGPGSLNPAGEIAGIVVGGADPSKAIMNILGQFVGAFLGAVLVYLVYLPHWAETNDAGLKLAVFSTGPAIRNTGANVLTEVIATFALIFIVNSIFKAAGPTLPGGLGPYLVGALIWGLGLSLGGPTGYALNPARDLGPRIAHFVLPIPGKGDSDWGYSWIPVVGPIIGAIIGLMVFNAVAG
ncbi:MAG: aquaporin family protein [Chloroflexi bacterium SZAS-1]|nr:aquaporin family protein [Chloroflexi bacterium SZAS-1]